MKFITNILLLLTIYLFSVTNIFAQVSNYSFSQAITSGYTPSGGIVHYTLKPPSNYLNPLKCLYAGDTIGMHKSSITGEGFPIGFNFKYNNEVFDRIAVAGNGYIKLGKSGNPITISNDTIPGSIFDDNSIHQNIIAIFQTDASVLNPAPTDLNQIKIQLQGTPGQKTCLISFTNSDGRGISMNQTIVLYEKNNTIEFVYQSYFFYTPLNINKSAAVGITGNSEFQNRKVIMNNNTWLTSVIGTNKTDVCDFNVSLKPTGSYIFTPPAPIPAVPACPETFFYVDAIYPNAINVARIPYDTNPNDFYIMADSAINIPTNSTINWSDVSISSNQPTSYDVFLDTDNPPVKKVAAAISTAYYTPQIMAPNTTYYYNIVPTNNSGSITSCIGQFKTSNTNAYCIAPSPGAALIKNFSINTLSFSVNSTNQATNKFDAIAPYTTSLQRNNSYTASITLTSSNSSNPWGNAGVKVFIDFNQDGDFDDTGESIVVGGGSPNSTFTYLITIPANAKLGNTVMRVRNKASQDTSPMNACNEYWIGGSQDFIITITPAAGCEDFNFNTAIQNISCHGQNDGSIQLNISGGTTPYSINWTDNQNTSIRENLPKAIYQASVTDANNCQIQTPLISITQPQPLTAYADTATDKSIDIHVSGGTEPLSFLWSNGDTYTNPDLLQPGTYNLVITDNNGCDTMLTAITIPAITGVTHQQNNYNITYFPNPATEQVTIQSDALQLNIEFINSQGIMCKEIQLNKGTTTISVNDLSPGMYLLKCSNNSYSNTFKLIKK